MLASPFCYGPRFFQGQVWPEHMSFLGLAQAFFTGGICLGSCIFSLDSVKGSCFRPGLLWVRIGLGTHFFSFVLI